MSGVNKVILIGHLGRDPEIRRTTAGDMIASFSLATSETWRDKDTGERKERTEWHNVVIFNDGLAKIAEQYLKKGSKVYLEGQMRTRDYEGRDGIKRRTTEVVLAKFRGELTLLDSQSNRPPAADSQDDYGTTRSTGQPQRLAEAIDDEIPF
jgi:single-strand DNA-binding protein